MREGDHRLRPLAESSRSWSEAGALDLVFTVSCGALVPSVIEGLGLQTPDSALSTSQSRVSPNSLTLLGV